MAAPDGFRFPAVGYMLYIQQTGGISVSRGTLNGVRKTMFHVEQSALDQLDVGLCRIWAPIEVEVEFGVPIEDEAGRGQGVAGPAGARRGNRDLEDDLGPDDLEHA